jgi:hypothetical protein
VLQAAQILPPLQSSEMRRKEEGRITKTILLSRNVINFRQTCGQCQQYEDNTIREQTTVLGHNGAVNIQRKYDQRMMFCYG